MKKYSFKKGFWKGALSLLSIGGALLAFSGFADVTVWGLAEEYIKPLIGSLSVGGIITIAINWIKVKHGDALAGIFKK